ncbi:MAG TPA: hypothetical protein VJ438_05425 [Candidatus Nanoarchaeia archaeon]|nr:hypothetical protein [Candidatus Nanoarchaeia archaeon]
MSLQETSEKFKELFLLAFTRELIIHAGGGEVLELESELELEKQETKEKIKDIVKEELKPSKSFAKFKALPKPFILAKRLVIPIQRFPERLSYIQPIPTPIQVDLGKLNPLIKDPMVQTIECHGPDKKIIVRTPSERETEISLTKEEINNIVKTFSEHTKIPAEEGVFRVALGRIVFTAIISDIVGTKFMIKKLLYQPTPPQLSYLKPTRAFGVPAY